MTITRMYIMFAGLGGVFADILICLLRPQTPARWIKLWVNCAAIGLFAAYIVDRGLPS